MCGILGTTCASFRFEARGTTGTAPPECPTLGFDYFSLGRACLVENIACPLQEAALATPDLPAIVAAYREFTYREYHEHVCGTVKNLAGAGVSPGEPLAITLPPGTPYPLLLMAAFRLGALAFPLNPQFPMQYLLAALKQVRCHHIVVPYGASETTVRGHLNALAPRDLVEDCGEHDGTVQIPIRRPASIVLTSGSSGAPKPAVHCFYNHYRSACLSNQNLPVGPGNRWLMSLPLYHVAGLGVLFRCLLGRGAVVFPKAKESIPEAVERYRITHLSLVPTQLHRLLHGERQLGALKGLKAILLGGGPIQAKLVRAAVDAGLPIFTSYGSTEMATQVSATCPGESAARLLTAGRPLDPGNVRIAADGEIQVRGDTLFLGYMTEGQIVPPDTEDGWFATGDLGAMDGEGHLAVVGRKDNMFVSGGENIQPEEIEACLCRADGVCQAVVAPTTHAEFGATPVAFVQLEEGAQMDAEAFSKALAEHLPRYKIPRHYLPWPEEATGPLANKISRQDFIERARQLTDSVL